MEGTRVLLLPHEDVLEFGGGRMSRQKVGVTVMTKEKEARAIGQLVVEIYGAILVHEGIVSLVASVLLSCKC